MFVVIMWVMRLIWLCSMYWLCFVLKSCLNADMIYCHDISLIWIVMMEIYMYILALNDKSDFGLWKLWNFEMCSLDRWEPVGSVVRFGIVAYMYLYRYVYGMTLMILNGFQRPILPWKVIWIWQGSASHRDFEKAYWRLSFLKSISLMVTCLTPCEIEK